jgi:hypothetical protein
MEIFTRVNCNETSGQKARSFFGSRIITANRLPDHGKMCGGLTVSLSEHKIEGMFPTSVGL